MRTLHWLILAAGFGNFSLLAQTTAPLLSLDTPTIIERGPHHRVWSRWTSSLDEVTGETLFHTNRYVELQTGVCYADDKTAQWLDSVCEIELHPEGAALQRTQHKMIFAANLNTAGAIDLLTPDGKRLRSNPLGLAYYDPATGKSVWIGGIQDCTGELLPPNQVLYRNAFSNINATVRYTVTKAGMEQDIVLLESPSLKPEDLGLSEYARLEVVTEFHEFTPPDKQANVLQQYPQIPGKAAMAETEFVDEDLSFGAMRTGKGKAFKLNQPESDPGLEVGKRFGTTSGGRSFMIEGVEYQAIRSRLSALPPSRSGVRTAMLPQPSSSRVFPPASVARKDKAPLMLAKTGLENQPGFVIDYQLLLVGTNNFTFKGDTTYWVTGAAFMTNTIIEGGTVIKYAPTNTAYLDMSGTLKTETSAYRPAIFTAEADNTVGEVVTNATLSGYYGNVGMWLYTGSVDLQYLDFRYVKIGLCCFRNSLYNFSHLRFVNMNTGIQQHGSTNAYRNVLFDQVLTPLNFTLYTNRATFEQATFSRASYLAYPEASTSNTLLLTNSLIVQVASTNNQAFTAVNCGSDAYATNVFQTVGAGANYLKDDTYRNQGATNINATLAKDLARLTTYPPETLTNTTLTDDTTLWPQAQRDTDTPDIGYHYPSLDYLVSSLEVTNATLTLTNGVAVGVYGQFGLQLRSGSKLVSEGTPNNLNHLVRYQTVQEQPLDLQIADYNALVHGGYYCNYQPQIQMKFTDIATMADGVKRINLLRNPYPMNPIELTDCQLHGVRVYLYPNYGIIGGVSLYVTNCLWDRVSTDLAKSVNGDTGQFTLHFRNTTLRGGYFYASTSPSMNTNNMGIWSFCDNAFVQVDNWFLHQAGIWTNLCNAYYASGLLPNSTSNITMPSAQFLTGTLGRFYIVTNSVLIDAGSRYATNAGLYHYTTQTNNVKETNSWVDIGFHYVATDNDGNPLDEDGDGLPDYWEDRNGNGTYDAGSGETDWQTYDSMNGLTSNKILEIFTPLRD